MVAANPGGRARHDTIFDEVVIEHVIEAMVDAVLVVDADGRITLSNSAATKITGFTPEQLRSMPVAQLLVDDSSGLRTVVRHRIEQGAVLRREESWLVTQSGERIPVSVTGSPALTPEGGFLGIVLVARDIRELRQLLADKEAEIVRRRAAEAELRALNASIEEQLEQTRQSLLLAERRSTLGTLAGGVGHELRNIAQIQISALDELQAALAASDDLAELARALLPDLQRVGDHITAHGKRLMQLARPGSDQVEPIDLDVLVTDMVAMLQRAGKLRHVKVNTNLGNGPATVLVNRIKIEQILVNLIGNAVDAIGDDPGTITIEVRPSEDSRRLVCEVRDTGSGILPEVLDKIFQPFFTTKPEDKGTGLGLPVASEIVKSYGGNLAVDSTVGAGTMFRFDLPR
jgi:PAS domain S-box-containing protein